MSRVISDAERDRRHRDTRQAMARAGIEVLVVVSDAHHKGDVLYLTNHHIWSQRAYCVLTQDAGPILVVAMASQDYWAKATSWAREVRWSPAPIREVTAVLKSGLASAHTIGVSGLQELMPLGDYEHLRTHAGGATIVDATEVLQEVRARKSGEELAGLRESAEVARAGFAVLSECARPGVSEFEIVGEVERVVRARGAGATLILTSQGPYLRHPTGRILREGDFQMFSVELCGASGYWVELGGMLAIGQVADSALATYDACQSAFDAGLAAIRIGATGAKVAEALLAAFEASGREAGIWGGHGIGLDTVEKPRLTPTDQTVLSEGMAVGFHPHVIDPGGIYGAYIADTIVVTADGPARLGATGNIETLVRIGRHTA